MRYLILAALIAGPAYATGSAYEYAANASAVCQPALPVYDTNIRKRPLAFINESRTQTSAFGNCMFGYQSNSYGTQSFQLTLKSFRTSPVTVACTGVLGTEGNARFVVRSYPLPAGGSALVKFTAADFNRGSEYKAPGAIQCLLPDDVGATETMARTRHSN